MYVRGMVSGKQKVLCICMWDGFRQAKKLVRMYVEWFQASKRFSVHVCEMVSGKQKI
jgi:hypothetical protein